MKKLILLNAFILLQLAAPAQPDLTLTLSQMLTWQSAGNQANVSTVPLSNRVKSGNYQLSATLDSNAKILYSPDGMDNFGPYIDSAHKFNLFNFSHWQYIDILAWFGGSASAPILVPSKAWVDAAHKNGVKVIGTVFFAPVVFGGTQAAMQNFLQKDASGNFIAADKLIQIANYYNFDGWIMNCETQVNSATGALMASFMNRMDSAYGGELIWYDSMLQNGSISYQNKLNANNSYFFTHSTGLFTNYSWSQASTVASSQSYANSIGQSPFKVYTGADLWPTRNAQPAFTNYTWIDKIITAGVAKTSIALFATNFTFNYAGFSTFNNDSTDYADFYTAERKIFSGNDQNPFAVDAQWKGLSNYITVRSTITSIPFESDFNTGHGFNYYNNGNILTAGSWHNMSYQSILPSWTFFATGVSMSYDFNTAYSGGSSLSISSAAAGNYSIPLYSTKISNTATLLDLGIALKSSSTTIDSISLEIRKKDNSMVYSTFHPSFNGSWESISGQAAVSVNDTLVEIRLLIHSTGAFALNLGKISVLEDSTSGIFSNTKEADFSIYPNPSNGVFEVSTEGSAASGEFIVYDLEGRTILKKQLKNNSKQSIELPNMGVYIYEFTSGNKSKQGKIVVH